MKWEPLDLKELAAFADDARLKNREYLGAQFDRLHAHCISLTQQQERTTAELAKLKERIDALERRSDQ